MYKCVRACMYTYMYMWIYRCASVCMRACMCVLALTVIFVPRDESSVCGGRGGQGGGWTPRDRLWCEGMNPAFTPPSHPFMKWRAFRSGPNTLSILSPFFFLLLLHPFTQSGPSTSLPMLFLHFPSPLSPLLFPALFLAQVYFAFTRFSVPSEALHDLADLLKNLTKSFSTVKMF